MRNIPYDASRLALYHPDIRDTILESGDMPSEDLVCAEAARLVYKKFERQNAAAEEIRQALEFVGFGDLNFFAGQGSEAFGAINPATATAVLAFRGTEQDPTDISTDLRTLPGTWQNGGRVHDGFFAAFERVRPQIDPWIKAQRSRVLFTGHSLGAAWQLWQPAFGIPADSSLSVRRVLVTLNLCGLLAESIS